MARHAAAFAALVLGLAGPHLLRAATGPAAAGEGARGRRMPEPRRVRPLRVKVRARVRLDRPPPLTLHPRQRSRPAYDTRRDWLFVGTAGGHLFALRGRDLSKRWERDVDGPVEAPLLLGHDRLYVATASGILLAIDPATGRSLWRRDLGLELGAEMRLVQGRLLVPGLGDTLSVVDAEQGDLLWQVRNPAGTELGIRGVTLPAVAGDLVLMGFSDGSVVALGLEDGKERWRHRTKSSAAFDDVDAGVVVEDGVAYVVTYAGRAYGLSVERGEVVWTGPERVAEATHLFAAAGELIVVRPGAVVALDRASGRRLWHTRVGEGAPARPRRRGDEIWVSSCDGPAYVLSLRTGRPRAVFRPGSGLCAAPVLAGPSEAFAWSNNGYLYRLALP